MDKEPKELLRKIYLIESDIFWTNDFTLERREIGKMKTVTGSVSRFWNKGSPFSRKVTQKEALIKSNNFLNCPKMACQIFAQLLYENVSPKHFEK